MGDPVLREVARPVDLFDAALARLAGDMLETMYENHGVGLAAPQVGVSRRLFVCDDGETGPLAMANPELVDFEDEQNGEEGCLSLPGIYFDVDRALRVTARGTDVRGKPLELRGEGMLARIFQHEVDHLNGILFIDRLPKEERREALRQMREQDLEFHRSQGDPSRIL
jgi:peptide deformylase